MLTLKIVLQVLAVIISLFVIFLDYFFSDKNSLFFKFGRLLLIFLSISTLISGIIITIDDDQNKQRETAELKTNLAVLQKEAESIKYYVTGGDSFAYIDIDSAQSLMLYHNGEYPIYDIQIKAVNYESTPLEDTTDVKATFKNLGLKNIETLNPKQAIYIADLELPDDKEEIIIIFFILARNGGFSECLRFRKVYGNWMSAFRVRTDNPSEKNAPEVLLEKIPSDFQRYEGEDLWNFR